MNHIEPMEQLLREYGYPEQAIPSLLKEIHHVNVSYEQIEKIIMPYHDITAHKS